MATDPADSTRRRWSVYRFLLRPRWIVFHLLVAAMVVAMINLAFWQLRRLDERQQFNAQYEANSSQPIDSITDVLSPAIDPSIVEWRAVSVTGTYVPGHQFLVVNRSQNGDTGRNVVDALQLDDGSLLLINRGFVGNADDTPPPPNGPIEVVGRLRKSERRKTGQPADDGVGALTEIRRIDVPLLARQFAETVQPMYVQQDPTRSTPPDAKTLQPIVAPTLDEGPHLSYTIQWFIFSGCVIAGWVFAVRRSMAMRSGKGVEKRRSAYVPIADDESVK